MDNPQLVVEALDAIIQVRRQSSPNSEQATGSITDEERMELLEGYKQLETLKKRLNGKVLFEYNQGLETLVKEVVV